ncbi:MAG: hypothetical protein ACFB9N_10940 [Geitlerinemataceae cyanobacterium]
MKPKFKTEADWECAELLMQPALIRVLDRLRAQLETSAWTGEFREVTEPIPGHCLELTRGPDAEVVKSIHLWELCFRVCFQNYIATEDLAEPFEVEIDRDLIDADDDVDWERLDEKAEAIVRSIFFQLPADPADPPAD